MKYLITNNTSLKELEDALQLGKFEAEVGEDGLNVVVEECSLDSFALVVADHLLRKQVRSLFEELCPEKKNKDEIEFELDEYMSTETILSTAKVVVAIDVLRYLKDSNLLKIGSFMRFNMNNVKADISVSIELYKADVRSRSYVKKPLLTKLGEDEKEKERFSVIHIYDEARRILDDDGNEITIDYLKEQLQVILHCSIGDNLSQDYQIYETIGMLTCLMHFAQTREVEIHGDMPIELVNMIRKSVEKMDSNARLVFSEKGE